MTATRKKIITIETWQRTVIHRDSSQTIWCEFCAAEVKTATPEAFARQSGITQRELFRRLENGELHFFETETGEVFICQHALI